MSSNGQKESQKYADMMAEVEGIVNEISSGKLDLDMMVTRVEDGYGLIRKMRERLGETKERVEKLRLEFEEDKQS